GREIAFPVEVSGHDECVVYFRLEDRFAVIMGWKWWPRALDFFAAKERGLLTDGVYFGLLFALLGYNALLWLRLRSADIGCYVRYLTTTAAFMLLLRSALPALGWAIGWPPAEMWLTLSLALSGFFLAQFARVFLELGAHSPRADRAARALRGVMLVIA